MHTIAAERPWRAKLYSLSPDGEWQETGTGFIHFQGRTLLCESETDSKELLRQPVEQEVYRRQGKTILLWTLPDARSYAVSFQQPKGAQETIEHLCRLQERDPKDIEDEEPSEEESTALPDLSTASGLTSAVQQFSSLHFQAKQHLAEDILSSSFISRLETVFIQAETAQDQASLESLFHIYKELVHFCHVGLMEVLLEERHFEKMMGALEYDPVIKGKNMKFREFIRSVAFRNVLNVTDGEFLTLIHRNYRLQYLKDTALARCLDENCIGFLTNYQLSQWNETVSYVNRSVEIRKILMERLKEIKIEGFEMLGELGNYAKSVAAYTRIEFYELLCAEDIFGIFTKAIEWEFPPNEALKVKVVISDLAACLVTLAPTRARDFFTSESQRLPSTSLLQSSCSALLSSREISVIQQLSDFFHTLLDPSPDKHLSEVIPVFYDSILPSFITSLRLSSPPSEETRLCLCELLSILSKCVLFHTYRVRFVLLNTEAFPVILDLLEWKDKPIILSVMRFFKSVVEKNDHLLIRHLVTLNALQRIWKVFIENGTRENMLFSSILAFIHAIKIADNSLLIEQISQRHLNLFGTSPLKVHFEGWVEGKRGNGETYAQWNPREISAKEDEAYFEDSDEDRETLKREFPEGETENRHFEKKTKEESADCKVNI